MNEAATSDDPFVKWARAHRKLAESGRELLWPSETLIRLFKGPYLPSMSGNHRDKKVLDVGFGNGNNLIFLGSLGLDLYGTEVTQAIVDTGADRLATLGYQADLQVGTNRALPYESDTFDYLVSWNVVHYEDNERDIRAAIAEYARVLKPGGRLFLSTTGPDHKILLNSRSVGEHRYQIGRDDDFRKGQVFFYFDTKEVVHDYFSPSFSEVQVGRTYDHLLTETLDWFIVSAVKP